MPIYKLCADCGAPLGSDHVCPKKPLSNEELRSELAKIDREELSPLAQDKIGQLEDQAGAAQKETEEMLVNLKRQEALSRILYTLAEQYHNTSKLIFSLAEHCDQEKDIPDKLRRITELTVALLRRTEELNYSLIKNEGQDDDDKEKTGSAGIAENPE